MMNTKTISMIGSNVERISKPINLRAKVLIELPVGLFPQTFHADLHYALSFPFLANQSVQINF
jgi:hypothetical protein